MPRWRGIPSRALTRAKEHLPSLQRSDEFTCDFHSTTQDPYFVPWTLQFLITQHSPATKPNYISSGIYHTFILYPTIYATIQSLLHAMALHHTILMTNKIGLFPSTELHFKITFETCEPQEDLGHQNLGSSRSREPLCSVGSLSTLPVAIVSLASCPKRLRPDQVGQPHTAWSATLTGPTAIDRLPCSEEQKTQRWYRKRVVSRIRHRERLVATTPLEAYIVAASAAVKSWDKPLDQGESRDLASMCCITVEDCRLSMIPTLIYEIQRPLGGYVLAVPFRHCPIPVLKESWEFSRDLIVSPQQHCGAQRSTGLTYGSSIVIPSGFCVQYDDLFTRQ